MKIDEIYEKMRADLIIRAEKIYEELNIRLSLNKGKQSKLSFSVVDDKEINGKAWVEPDNDCVEINSGVIREYLSYFQEVNDFYNSEFWETINPISDSEETEDIYFGSIMPINGELAFVDSQKIRYYRTEMMELFVSRFILLHEIGHIFNGHCQYMKDYNKLDYILMNYSDCSDAPSGVDIRTMEMDADMFATTQSMIHLYYLYLNYDTEVQFKDRKPIHLFYWWSFSIRSHFLISEDRHGDSFKYSENMRHLPSNTRWAMMMSTALELCDKLDDGNCDPKEVARLLLEGAKEAERVFNIIKCANYSGIDEIKADTQYKKYYDEVNHHWEILVKELKKYARAPLFEG